LVTRVVFGSIGCGQIGYLLVYYFSDSGFEKGEMLQNKTPGMK
jgi:hypothetical protein